MKKTFCVILALTLALLAFSACGREKTPGGEPPSTDPQTTADAGKNAVDVAGVCLNLTYDARLEDLHFKTDEENLTPNTVLSLCEMRCEKDGELLLAIHLVYFENKTAEEVMDGSDNVLSDKTVNGQDYKYFEYDENGMPGHTYLAEFGGAAYTISFASNADISALETAFMENVRFAAE